VPLLPFATGGETVHLFGGSRNCAVAVAAICAANEENRRCVTMAEATSGSLFLTYDSVPTSDI